MKDFRVKLISLPAIHSHLIYCMYLKYPPYGLGVLTAFLRDNHCNVSLDDLSIKIENHNKSQKFSLNSRINLNILRRESEIMNYACGHSRDRKIEQFAQQITQLADYQGYDLIGISVMSYYHFIIALLLSKIIKSTSDARVALGGPFITMYGKYFFEQFPIADYMIIGDGQIPLMKLVGYLKGQLSIEDIPGLFYRQNSSIKANPRKHFPIEDLYPPGFSGLPLNFYRLKIDNQLYLPYQITRGCIHKCSFCSRNLTNPFLEFKSYDKVIRELRAMKQRYQSNYFWFYDDTINCSYEYLDRLCDIFIEEKLDIYWRTAARTDNLDRRILHKMEKAGCRLLSFGIESGSNRILKAMCKDFTRERAAEVLKNSYLEGIENWLNLIVGFPHEKEEDIIETIEFIKKNSRHIDAISAIVPLRLEYGTPLYNNPEEFGIKNLRPIFHDYPMSYAFDEIDGLKSEDKLKQQEYSLNRILKANFKYIIFKKYSFVSIVLFGFGFWLTKRLSLLFVTKLPSLYERLLPYLFRKRGPHRRGSLRNLSDVNHPQINPS